MQLHLALPGLLWPARVLPDMVFDLDLPALSWLLGRARSARSQPLPLETWLARRCGCDGAEPPLAALRRLGEGDAPDSAHWICADPAHLAFDHGRPLLADPAGLELDDAEIEELTVALAPTFAEAGEFSLRPPGHGYLKLRTPAAIAAAPLSAVVGRGGGGLLPRGPDAARWVRLANDAQIALHDIDLNRRREADGRPTINTLWFWGAGALPARAAKAPFEIIVGGDTLAHGAARHAGMAWLAAGDALPATGSTLLIDDRLLAPARQLDAGAWREAALALERERIAPLVAMLRRGSLARLTLSALGDEATLELELRRGGALRFWRRPRPLAAMAEMITA